LNTVLRLATFLMSLYATFSIGWGANDLLQVGQLEPWASIAMIAAGMLLLVGILMTRASVPGGLPICAAALLARQALDVHNASRLETPIALQIALGVLAAAVLALAALGARKGKRGNGKWKSEK
jgi:hypothetical protein